MNCLRPVLLSLLACGMLYPGVSASQEVPIEVRLPARWQDRECPPFVLNDLNGREYSTDRLKGRVVVLNFWFIACAPCRKEMPDLNRLVEEFSDREDVIFLAPGTDDPESVRRFLATQEFAYTALPDAATWTIETLGVTMWPSHFIIDKMGVIRFVMVGGSDEIATILKDRITPLL